MTNENAIYPPSPVSVPENLTKPTSKYKLHAWMALGGIFLFVGLYILLTYLFISLSLDLLIQGDFNLGAIIVGAFTAFCAIFMIKSLFFVKRFDDSKDVEITAENEPELFRFIHQIADEVQAPRPHKIFLSPRVNACVFYDLSLINLLYPTKKNLEIGLGLVNVLNLNEFKAVIAHEFGHFAQKTMAVGRWVYILRQVAEQIVVRRDAFDGFIRGISYTDLRIAWIGWLLNIIVWSIRALIETAFMVVVMAERALSREMEFQADLVSVSLSGSDSIVNSLYRLETADDAWDKAVNYTFELYNEGKVIPDFFEIQKYFIQKIGVILDKPDYGNPPILANPASERAFKKNIASPPKMWSTHPASYEREENAKRIYVPMTKDERSAWLLFQLPTELKAKMTKTLLGYATKVIETVKSLTPEEAIADLDKRFDKNYYAAKYRGFYLNQSLTRNVAPSWTELYTDNVEKSQIPSLWESLYPESLKQELTLLADKKEELALLQAVHEKGWEVSDNTLTHNGKQISRRELPKIIDALMDEVEALEQKFVKQNRKIRSLHAQIARETNPSWEKYLKGLVSLIHYSEHTIANMNDISGVLQNTLVIILADKNVSANEMNRLLADARKYYDVLNAFFSQTPSVYLDENMLKALNTGDWKSLFEPFKLGIANQNNINEWLAVVDSWRYLAIDKLEMLRSAALEELLRTEEKLAAAYQNGESLEQAPVPSASPEKYTSLLIGQERKLQSKLGWWERFYTADGLIPSILRLTVAVAIIGSALYFATGINKYEVFIYNGLGTPVKVNIGGNEVYVNANESKSVNVSKSSSFHIKTETENGELIEELDGKSDFGKQTYIYNVAAAAGFVKYNVVYFANGAENYGEEGVSQTELGFNNWISEKADFYFQKPPESITMSEHSTRDTRSTIMAYSNISPYELLSLAKTSADSTRLIRTHLLWDDENSLEILNWLEIVKGQKNAQQLLNERLSRKKNEILSIRALQDLSPDQEAVYQEYKKKYEANPEDGNAYYLMLRVMKDGQERSDAVIKGYQKWEKNPWISYMAGSEFEKNDRFQETEKAFVNAAQAIPGLSEILSIRLAHIYKAMGKNPTESPIQSAGLTQRLAAEKGELEDTTFFGIYQVTLGKFDDAMALAKNNTTRRNILIRYIGASDGASPDMVRQAVQDIDEEGITDGNLFFSIGLLLREGKDIKWLWDKRIGKESEETRTLTAFMKGLQKGISESEGDAILRSLDIKTRANAYCLAAVYLQEKCPPKWKSNAKKWLFSFERPYFK